MDLLELDRQWISRTVHESFSGGERKRFEVLQALLLEPKVLILDEIDSGLDAHSCALVGAALSMFHKEHPETSLLIITHTNQLLSYLKPTKNYYMHEGSLQERHGA
jgi:Fe-S cluster assembly ATP-binding protein